MTAEEFIVKEILELREQNENLMFMVDEMHESREKEKSVFDNYKAIVLLFKEFAKSSNGDIYCNITDKTATSIIFSALKELSMSIEEEE